MNKPLLKRLALLAALLLACNAIAGLATPTSTPTALPSASPTPEILHFENEFVAFDYPAGMRIFTANKTAFNTYPFFIQLGGEFIIGMANPIWIKLDTLYSSIGIFRHLLPSDSTLDEIMQISYKDVPLQNIVADGSGPITIDGLAAYQKTYRVASGPLWYTLRDIWVEKEGGILRLSIWKEDYAMDFEPTAEMFINSIEIKDNLPPLQVKPTTEPTSSPTPVPASMLLHFENDVVAFDYLKGMTLFFNNNPAFVCYPSIDLGGEMVAGLGDPRFLNFDTYFRSIRITRRPIPTGSNLEALFLETYQQAEEKFPQKPGILDARGKITIDGLTAIQKSYRVYSGEPAYELRDIWTQKGDEIFILSIWTEYTNPDDFAAFQSSAEVFINSLRIK